MKSLNVLLKLIFLSLALIPALEKTQFAAKFEANTLSSYNCCCCCCCICGTCKSLLSVGQSSWINGTFSHSHSSQQTK